MHPTRLLLALVCLLPAGSAAAQDNLAEARSLFERGVSAMDAGDSATASTYFERSYQAYPRASTACNMALALERTQRSCDAESWYRQCAALDQNGRFRDHANRQAAALSAQCTQPSSPIGTATPVATPDPPAGGDAGQAATSYESGAGLYAYDDPGGGVDHTLLGLGITSLVLGVGALVGGAFSAGEASFQAGMLPVEAMTLVEGTPSADIYFQAETFSNLAIGLYAGAGALGLLGAVLIIIDLAQPGVFGSAANQSSVQLALSPSPGGAAADLTVRF